MGLANDLVKSDSNAQTARSGPSGTSSGPNETRSRGVTIDHHQAKLFLFRANGVPERTA